jgi:hypothetical protein
MPTDYTTKCGGDVPLTFIQMLASCIRGYHDIKGDLHYRLNGLEVADDATTLSNFHECDTSHIEPERLLVENVFAFDECTQLGIKLFSNGDNDWVDNPECAENPQSFIEMLARTIRIYSSTAMINSVIESAACADMTPLLNCSTNNIESERLLVSNVFAFDDQGNFLIKFITDTSTMTDYHVSCYQEAQTFYQMLARCIVLYQEDYYINLASVDSECADTHDFWTCANNHLDPEGALVDNLFATDSCGNLALKIINNHEEEQ